MAEDTVSGSEVDEPLQRALKPIKTREVSGDAQHGHKDSGWGGKEDADELHFPPSPVTPVGRVFRKKFFDVYIICIIGLVDPVDIEELHGHLSKTLLRHKRFCSIMKERRFAGPLWTQVPVKLDEHIIRKEVAPDPEDFGVDPVEAYAEKLATAQPLDRSRPLWQVHVLAHPRRGDCGGSLVFRIHHSIGDGISLMSLLMACSHQTADPTLLPTLAVPSTAARPVSFASRMGRPFVVAANTIAGMNAFSAMVACVPDSKTAVMGHPGIETAPRRITCSEDFDLQEVNLVKSTLTPAATVNDVLLTVLAGGLQKYLERRLQDDKELNDKGSGEDKLPVIEEGRHEGYDNSGVFSGSLSGPLPNGHANGLGGKREAAAKKSSWGCFGGKAASETATPTPATATPATATSAKPKAPPKPRLLPKNTRLRGLALVNLRSTPGLQELKDMMGGKEKVRWGNKLGYLMVPLILDHFSDPLDRLRKMRTAIQARKTSLEAVLSYYSNLQLLRLGGATASAKLLYRAAGRVTTSISNVVGPSETVSLFGSRVVHITPTVVGVPQSMCLHLQSYRGRVKVVCQVAEALVSDPENLCDCFAEAFMELKAAAVALKGKKGKTA